MAKNRKAAQEVILRMVKDLDPSGKNTAVYEDAFKRMNDAQFDNWMQAIEKNQDFVSLIVDNNNNNKVTIENNLKVAKKWGVKLFQRLWLTDPNTGMTYLTPLEYLVLHLPVRRQIQTLENKVSIPEDNKHVDEMTGQPTGPSKGSSISFPELQVLYGRGLDWSIQELIKFRGGDEKGMRELEKSVISSGGVSLEALKQLGTRNRSTVTLSIFLKGMMLDNNF